MRSFCFAFSVLVGFSLLGDNAALANCVSGTPKLPVYGLEFGETPDEDDVRKLKEKSLKMAWKVYVETLPAKYLKAYVSQKAEIISELKFYIPAENQKFTYKYDEVEQQIIGTNCIKVRFKRLKTALKVEPDVPKIKSGEGSKFVTLFVAREASKEKSFDQVRETDASSKAGGKQEVLAKERLEASGGTAISIAKKKAKVSASSSSRSSGSTVRESDKT
jgi:hypothetical protein